MLAVALLCLFPAFFALHESSHYLRGLTFSPLYQNATLPASILQFIETTQSLAPKDGLVLHAPELLRSIELQPQVRLPYTADSNVMVYSFVNYIPQILAGTIGWLLDIRPINLFLLARGMSLLLGVVFGYGLLRLLPVYHVPVLLALLLPSVWVMRLQQYTDQAIIIAAWLYFALLLRVLHSKLFISNRYIIGFSLAGVAIAYTKMVYAPLMLAMLLIPSSQFGTRKRQVVVVSIIMAITLVASALSAYSAYQADYKEQVNFPYFQDTTLAGDAKAQWVEKKRHEKSAAVQTLLHHPEKVLQKTAALYTSWSFWQRNLREIYVWYMSPYADVLKPLGVIPLLLLLFCVTPLAPNSYAPDTKSRMLLLALVFASALLVAAALHTGGAGGLTRIQGRYFVPLLPFLGMALNTRLAGTWCGRVQLVHAILGVLVLVTLYLALLGVLGGTVFVF